jgi:hypothetical protein
MRALAWIALFACASGPDPSELEACWAINDAALARCGADLPCRHDAYAGEIAPCFDEAGCDRLATWLRCAAAAACTPGPDCAAKCSEKPGECARP